MELILISNVLKQVSLSFLIVMLAGNSFAAAPSLVISPKKIGPGDIMTVVVKNAAAPVNGTFNGKELHFNEMTKGFEAIVGVDLYLEPGEYPLAVSVNGKEIKRTLIVTKKKYPLQRLTLDQDKVTLSPENEARVEREQKITAGLWPVETDRLWNGVFIDPLPGKELGTPFGVRRIINNIPKNSHSGVDISADLGDPVHAPNDGKVALVDEQFFSGKSVILDHGQGIFTMFFHLSEVKVSPGQSVRKGDVIGLVGATGRASGPHLHWGVRIQGARVDPLQLIKLKVE